MKSQFYICMFAVVLAACYAIENIFLLIFWRVAMNNVQAFLEHSAYNMRVSTLKMTTQAGSGHPTSALSAADLVAALFFYAMHFDPQNPQNPNNDRFILSKGHASPILYAVWKELGVLSEQDLMTYRQFDSCLEGHPTPHFTRSEAATGSLGQGLSIGVGMALSARIDQRDFYTYVMLGDSEVAEGSIWEAAELASFYKLDHLIAILDCNRLGQTTETMEGHDVGIFVERFAAFGWHTLVVNGHDIHDIVIAFDEAKKMCDKPIIIIAKTLKGFGVEKAENKNGFHGKAFSKEELPLILQNMQERFSDAAKKTNYAWEPQLPIQKNKKNDGKEGLKFNIPTFESDKKISTRKAYGLALAELGACMAEVVSLDAEVKNSTYAEFFAEKFPDRFIQSFIAEQNMIGMAVGLAARGKVPFASTFAVFFTRAFDQIRMAAIGRAPLRLVGSHAGVSIGQDGPSQMGLEDIAMMRTIPHSVVLYPCDAVSTVKLVELMANRSTGISYLRTTRAETPQLYDANEIFEIGGCKILKQSDHDVACIIAAGITLFEALKAYEQLQKEGIAIAIIDLYSIKPLDSETLLSVAQKAGKNIITVEDHYREGGLGEAVVYALHNQDVQIKCLAVDKLPRSGKPEELLAYEGIDAAAIIKSVQKFLK